MKTIAQTARTLIYQLKATTDRRQQAAEQRQALAPFEPGQVWQYAPDSAKQEAITKVAKVQEQRTSEALYRLRQFISEHADEVKMEITVRQRQAPSPADAWTHATGNAAITAEAMFTRDLLDEVRRQRFERELHDAPAAVVLDAYTTATIDPFDQGNASLIRYVESLHGDAWSGPKGDKAADNRAVLALRAAINKQRDSRVPKALQEASDAIQEGRKWVGTFEGLGVQPLAPSDTEGEE